MVDKGYNAMIHIYGFIIKVFVAETVDKNHCKKLKLGRDMSELLTVCVCVRVGPENQSKRLHREVKRGKNTKERETQFIYKRKTLSLISSHTEQPRWRRKDCVIIINKKCFPQLMLRTFLAK